MSVNLPPPKLPNWNVPTVRNLPQIPKVGCVSGNATTQVGKQMGSFPDIAALPHIKSLKKVITEQIGTLIEGKLPQLARLPLYEARQVRLVSELAEMVQKATEIADAISQEVTQTIEACNQKINDLNSAKDEILSFPASARSAMQEKAAARYDEYIAEIEAQIGRLSQSLGCLA
jgi:hypothetical protein